MSDKARKIETIYKINFTEITENCPKCGSKKHHALIGGKACIKCGEVYK